MVTDLGPGNVPSCISLFPKTVYCTLSDFFRSPGLATSHAFVSGNGREEKHLGMGLNSA